MSGRSRMLRGADTRLPGLLSPLGGEESGMGERQEMFLYRKQ